MGFRESKLKTKCDWGKSFCDGRGVFLSQQWRRFNWRRFPRQQVTPSFTKEACKAVACSLVVGGPIYKTVGDNGVRQSTVFHWQDAQYTGETNIAN